MPLFGLGKFGGHRKEKKPKPDFDSVVSSLRSKRDSSSKLSNFLSGRNQKLRVAETVQRVRDARK